jgi:hypothetical protein
MKREVYAPLKSSLERISKGRISSSLRGFWSTKGLGLIAKSWDWNVCNVAMETSSSCLGDSFFSSIPSFPLGIHHEG